MKRSDGKLYNILLPIWMLIFLPTWLWLFLIPANYLIDRIVLRWSLGAMPEKGAFCRKNTWKICLAGFLSDLGGVCILLGVYFCDAMMSDSSPAKDLLEKIGSGIAFDPFSNIGAFLVTALSVAAAGALIYFIDRKILIKAGLSAEQARSSALKLAVITAPYLSLLPSRLLYE